LVSDAVTFGCELKLLLAKLRDEQRPESGKEFYSALKNSILADLTLVCEGQRLLCHKVSYPFSSFMILPLK
jgi:hypothetical protein